MRDPYVLLGVQPGATVEEIHDAYVRTVKRIHPDNFDKQRQPDLWRAANAALTELNQAYEQLKRGPSQSYSTRPTYSSASSPPPQPQPSSPEAGAPRPTPEKRKSRSAVKVLGMWAAIISGALFLVGVCDQVQKDRSPASQRAASATPDRAQTSSSPVAGDTQPSWPIVQTGSTVATTDVEQSDFKLKPRPLPSNGFIWRHHSREEVAPLEVKTTSGLLGEPETHYYVKLVNLARNTWTLAVFVRSGKSVTIKVPVGLYEMRYATGSTWYGLKHLFGPATAYNKADATLHFRFEGNQVAGYTVELYKQVSGNLETREISRQAWGDDSEENPDAGGN